jgi:hypothetical protein
MASRPVFAIAKTRPAITPTLTTYRPTVVSTGTGTRTFVGGNATITFNAPAAATQTDASQLGYGVKIDIAGSSFVREYTIRSGVTSYTITGLTNGTTYRCYVKSLGYTTDTEYSEPVNVIAEFIPLAPTITAITPASGTVRLTITPSVDQANTADFRLKVEVNDADGITPVAGVTTVDTVIAKTATTYDVTGLTNGVQYKFTIWGANTSGTKSQVGNTALHSPLAPPTMPTVTRNVDISNSEVITSTDFYKITSNSDDFPTQTYTIPLANQLPQNAKKGNFSYTLSVTTTLPSLHNITSCEILIYNDTFTTLLQTELISVPSKTTTTINKDNISVRSLSSTGKYKIGIRFSNRFNNSAIIMNSTAYDLREPRIYRDTFQTKFTINNISYFGMKTPATAPPTTAYGIGNISDIQSIITSDMTGILDNGILLYDTLYSGTTNNSDRKLGSAIIPASGGIGVFPGRTVLEGISQIIIARYITSRIENGSSVPYFFIRRMTVNNYI